MKYTNAFKLFLLGVLFSLSSCATLFGGQITPCQATRPKVGEQQRKLRPVPFVADILLFAPGLGIDFITHAIYIPCGDKRAELKEARYKDPVY